MADQATYTEARLIDAIVFVDGVEIPYATIELSWGMSSISTLRLSVEPDEIIDEWRPKAWVHVFIRDPFEQEAPSRRTEQLGENFTRDAEYDLSTYKLYWEGEVTAIDDVESDNQRQTVITAQDLWNIPAFTPTALVNLSQGIQVPFVNGSTFYGTLLGGEELNFIISDVVAKAFRLDEDRTEQLENADLTQRMLEQERARLTPDQIAVGILRYLGAFNAGYGVQLSRSDMVNKITGISDRAAELFLRTRLAFEIMKDIPALQPATSVMDYITQTISKFYYHFITIPFPAPFRLDPAQRGRSKYRSMAFLPNLYYSLPPMCNYLFPDQYKVRGVARNFMNEPTRMGLRSDGLEMFGGMTHLAPEWLTGFFSENNTDIVNQSQQDFSVKAFGTRDQDGDVTDAPIEEVDLNEIGLTGRTDNMMKYLMPEEIEKGVLYKEEHNAYQENLILASLNEDFTNENEDIGLGEQAAISRYERAVRDAEEFPTYMRLLAEYQLHFRKNSRSLNVMGPFNPWPVVGLPMLVLRQGRSYRGLLTGMLTRIDYNGAASTQYNLSYAQLLRIQTFEEQGDYQDAVTAFRRAVQGAAALQTKVVDLTDLSGLTAADREELAGLNNADKLSVLTTKAADSRRRSELAQGFNEDHQERRSLLEAALGDTQFDVLAEAAVRYSAFIQGVFGRRAQSLGDEDLDAIAFEESGLGSQYTEIADLIEDSFAELGRRADGTPTTLPTVLKDYELLTNLIAWARVVVESFRGTRRGTGQNFTNRLILSQDDSVQFRRLQAAITEATETIDAIDEQLAEIGTDADGADELLEQRDEARDTLGTARRRIELFFMLDYRSTLGTVLSLDVVADVRTTSLTVPVTFTNVVTDEIVTENRRFSELYEADFGVASNNINNFISEYEDRFGAGDQTIGQFASIGADVLGSCIREYLGITKAALVVDVTRQREFEEAINRINRSYAEFARFVTGSGLEIPPVLSFANGGLLDISSVDEELSAVVQPRNDVRGRRLQDPAGTYSARAEKVKDASLVGIEELQDFTIDITSETTLRYDEFIRLVRTIFPLGKDDQDTEYQRAKARGVVHEWANNLQARKTVSLDDFLTINGLKLKTESVVNFGMTTQFYRMVDDETEGDEFTSKGARSFFSKFGNNDRDALKENIDEIRRAATASDAAPDWRFTLSTTRQQLILAYTRRHMGSGAFQGKR